MTKDTQRDAKDNSKYNWSECEEKHHPKVFPEILVELCIDVPGHQDDSEKDFDVDYETSPAHSRFYDTLTLHLKH